MMDRKADVEVKVVSVDAGGRRGNCAEAPIVCSLVVELDFARQRGVRKDALLLLSTKTGSQKSCVNTIMAIPEAFNFLDTMFQERAKQHTRKRPRSCIVSLQ